ncbi:MAG TPA: glycine oxidase ThiO [Thermoanaerobaculia bacterium]|jgi:glycine oxidase
MTRSGLDVVIVGGGVIGCALAAELAGRGQSVALVERDKPGAEASGAAAGMLPPQVEARVSGPFFDLALESRGLYPAWARRLFEETDIDVGFRRTGLLYCGFEETETESLFASYAWQRSLGLAVEERHLSDLSSEIEGRLSSEVRRALFFPEEAVVDPRRLTRAVALSAEQRGVRLQTGIAALRFRIENGVCRGVDTESGPIEAHAVVDAAGAWAAFDSGLPLPVPVQPVRGQIVELAISGRPLSSIVRSAEAYVVPRPDGTVLLGSTEELVGFRKEVTAEAVEHLIAAAVRMIPSLKSARFLSAWAGLRPGTPDGLPVLGDSPVRGLYFATGHFRNGILLAPVTAKLVADVLLGVPTRDLSPFSVARFSGALRAV